MVQPVKILLLESIHPLAKQTLEERGFVVDVEKGSLSEPELIRRVTGYQVLGIRSKTNLSAAFFKQMSQLYAVGAFCIGTNQIDLEAANTQGIVVFNAPYSNTRSVAELVLCEIIALSRRLGDVNTKAHNKGWLKSAVGAKEVRGKTLGIVGYGHIGSQLSILAEAVGLRVVYYDIVKKLPLGNARAMSSLESLLRESDFVSLHVPETAQTQNMIGKRQLEMMKKGGFLLNASRGTVVDVSALAKSLNEGHLAGAAIDVFPEEPMSNDEPFESALQGLNNVILTPHIGGSTEEAQEAIGGEVSQSLLRFLTRGSTLGAVNFPQVDVPPAEGAQRIINVHRNVPGVLSEVNSIISRAGANIKAQYLSTDSHIGYLVLDMERADHKMVMAQIAALPTSIKTFLPVGG